MHEQLNSDLMLSSWWESVCKTINAMKWRMFLRFSKWVAL